MEQRREVDAKIWLQTDVEKRTGFVRRQWHLVAFRLPRLIECGVDEASKTGIRPGGILLRFVESYPDQSLDAWRLLM